VVGTGEATCMGCGYEYQPKNGDPEYPITPGTYFSVRPVFIIQLFIQGVVCADVASHTQTTAQQSTAPETAIHHNLQLDSRCWAEVELQVPAHLHSCEVAGHDQRL